MLKTIMTLVYLLFFWLIGTPFYWYLRIVRKKDKLEAAKKAQKIIQRGFRTVCFFCGIKLTITGQENIPTDRPVLYVCNHRSDVDAVVGYISVLAPTGFVAKKEIKKVPCIGAWMELMNCVFLDRENIREGIKGINQAISNIKEGSSMLIMPEGTRNQEKEMLPFKQGSFKIAEKTGCPIVPMAISNTDAVFEQQKPRIKGAKVSVQFGKPIYLEDMSKEKMKNLNVDVRDVIAEMLDNQTER